MAARRKKTELCGECFPYGLDDQPADATQVSCEHGAWDVEPPAPEDPPPPAPKVPDAPKAPADPSGGDPKP